jgi:hypothetical protein
METHQVINEAIREWAPDFVQQLIESAEKHIDPATGSDSNIRAEIVRASLSTAAEVIVSFKTYLRLFDMRRVDRSTMVNVDDLRDWVRRVGPDKFIAKYKGRTDISETQLINNIAWSIARKKRKHRRRRWYNQLKGQEVYSLYFTILGRMQREALREAKADYKA